jgi:hypothetical protein
MKSLSDIFENMNPNQASIFIEEDSGKKVTRDRAYSVWRRRNNDLSHDKNDKPMKKQTKPEVKKQLEELKNGREVILCYRVTLTDYGNASKKKNGIHY